MHEVGAQRQDVGRYIKDIRQNVGKNVGKNVGQDPSMNIQSIA